MMSEFENVPFENIDDQIYFLERKRASLAHHCVVTHSTYQLGIGGLRLKKINLKFRQIGAELTELRLQHRKYL